MRKFPEESRGPPKEHMRDDFFRESSTKARHSGCLWKLVFLQDRLSTGGAADSREIRVGRVSEEVCKRE